MSIIKALYKIFCFLREFFVSLFFILFVLFGFAFFSLLGDSRSSAVAIPEKAALRLNLDGYLADNHDESEDLRAMLQSELGEAEPMKISTFDVALAISKAAQDSRITGLVLDLSYFEGGDFASLKFLGESIKRFKASNKPVIAIGDQYSQKQYYLASFADKIYLNKAGYVELNGLSYSNIYFKSLLDELEIRPHIFRVGTYKSAVEPFMRDDMSAEAKANAQGWLNSVWNNVQNDIAQNRGIKANEVLPAVDQYLSQYKKLAADDAKYALERKLVTHIASHSEIQTMLTEQFGEDDEGNYQHIDYVDYANTLPDRFNRFDEHKIAVVNVEGDIVLGTSDENSAGSETIVKLLRQANQDPAVRGIILRVNSPGGSAMASELIRQELEDIQKTGKPVVASMGGMAASGGYWISATADKIIASPTTITGSIGIFGLSADFEKTAKRWGVSEDGVETYPLAHQSNLKPLSKAQSELIQVSIENGYDRFIDLVSRGRKLSKTEVDKVAQGQVWSGEQAKNLGLVDKLGDFNMAYNTLIEIINAERLANNQTAIDHFGTQWFIEEDHSFLGSLMKDMKAEITLKMANWFNLPSPAVAQSQQAVKLLDKFTDPKHSYLYCLNCGKLE